MTPLSPEKTTLKSPALLGLSHEEVGKNLQSISKVKIFINKYEQKGINYPSGKDDWNKFEKQS